jgi:hypothetical protein
MASLPTDGDWVERTELNAEAVTKLGARTSLGVEAVLGRRRSSARNRSSDGG